MSDLELQGGIRVCERCGARLPVQEGSGRRRRYCPSPNGCKQSAYRSRSFRNTGTTNEALRNEALAHTPIRPILKYPGAKWRLAPQILPYFPPHHHYVEPYCGSAACFFLKEPSAHEVLNDLNGSIVNLFRVIRERGEELARAIEMTAWSEEEYLQVEKQYTKGDAVERARRFLIRCWQAHGVRLPATSGWKHNGLDGRAYPVRLWKQLPDRLLAVVDRLRDAEIRQRPGLEIIQYYNASDVLLYVDPPYVLRTRKGVKFYSHEMTDAEHLTLLDALDAHKGFVVLSGYAHPLYDERLQHWQRVTLQSVAEHGQLRTEVLWLNQKAARCQQLSLFAV